MTAGDILLKADEFQNLNDTNYAQANWYWQPWYQWPYYVPPANIGVYYPYVPQITLTPPVLRCAWCQGSHTDKCPRLKSVTYRSNGTVERIEFYEEGDRQD